MIISRACILLPEPRIVGGSFFVENTIAERRIQDSNQKLLNEAKEETGSS